jgi:hypothetical protein
VYKAIELAGWQAKSFDDWGVVAGPRFLGRPAMAAALHRFAAEGAWGVSPHLIPHRSLHSISGTVSQALKIHGPNFGVGGGPNAVLETLLAALALLEGKKLPGVWAVLTGLDPELPPDEAGRMAPGTYCVGLALALTSVPISSSRIRLQAFCQSEIQQPTTGCLQTVAEKSGLDLPRLGMLLQLLQGQTGGETAIVQLHDSGCRIEMSRSAKSADSTAETRIYRSRLVEPNVVHGAERSS